MKKSIVCIFGFILSVLFISNAAAEPASLTWKGDYTHGMYEGMRLTGSCLFDLEGDPFKQEAICKLRYFDPASAKRKVFKMTDPEAKIRQETRVTSRLFIFRCYSHTGNRFN